MTNFFKPEKKPRKQHRQKPAHLKGTRVTHIVLEDCPTKHCDDCGPYHHYLLERDNTGPCIKCGKAHPKPDNDVFERQLK